MWKKPVYKVRPPNGNKRYCKVCAKAANGNHRIYLRPTADGLKLRCQRCGFELEV